MTGLISKMRVDSKHLPLNGSRLRSRMRVVPTSLLRHTDILCQESAMNIALLTVSEDGTNHAIGDHGTIDLRVPLGRFTAVTPATAMPSKNDAQLPKAFSV